MEKYIITYNQMNTIYRALRKGNEELLEAVKILEERLQIFPKSKKETKEDEVNN